MAESYPNYIANALIASVSNYNQHVGLANFSAQPDGSDCTLQSLEPIINSSMP